LLLLEKKVVFRVKIEVKTEYGYFNVEKHNQEETKNIVVFLHGLPTGNFIWRNIIPFFHTNYQTNCIELLGCGDSDKNPNLKYDLKTQAKGIAEILKSYNQKVTLIAHDIGTGIAQRLLVENNHLINKAILINPIGYDYWPIPVVKLWRTSIMSLLLNAIFSKSFMGKVIKDGVYFKTNCDTPMLDLYTKNFNTPQKRQAIRKLMLSLDPQYLLDIVDKLKKVENEVLIIRAQEDIYLTKEISLHLSQDLPHSTLLEIPRTGHFIQEDIPGELASILIQYIKGTFYDRK
jgi:pimeloyl-ACP methyl ester carboxylesterase